MQRMLVRTSVTSCMNSTAEESSPVPTFCRYVATKLGSDWWKNTYKRKNGEMGGRGREGGRKGKKGGGEKKKRREGGKEKEGGKWRREGRERGRGEKGI